MSRKILCDLRDISFPQPSVSMSAKYFQLKTLKVIAIFSDEQMRGSRKMWKLKWNVNPSVFNCSGELVSHLKHRL